MGNSVELSGNIGDRWDQVDGSTGDQKGWLSSKEFASNGVDLGGGYLINLVAVLMESKISVGHEVSSDFFKSVITSLHSHEHVHLQDVLGSVKLSLVNWVLEAVELLDQERHKFLRVGSWTLDGHTEETGVREVGVDGGSSVNEVMLLHKVGDGSAVHSLAWTS